jgi:hypothetical protein
MPPICLGAALRQTSFAARWVALRDQVNMPQRRAATATPNRKSTFSRIIPMNPEPAAAPTPNPESSFPRTSPSVSQLPAKCFLARMTAPSRQTYGFTRLP